MYSVTIITITSNTSGGGASNIDLIIAPNQFTSTLHYSARRGARMRYHLQCPLLLRLLLLLLVLLLLHHCQRHFLRFLCVLRLRLAGWRAGKQANKHRQLAVVVLDAKLPKNDEEMCVTQGTADVANVITIKS